MKIIIALILNFSFVLFAVPRSYIDFAKTALLQSPIDKIIFVPGDQQPKKILLGLIQSEATRISAALFRFTDKDIAQELVNAVERGVEVELILDTGCFTDNPKVIEIIRGKISGIYSYSRYFSIMHWKHLGFANTLGGKKIVWTGSANITTLGLSKNQEYIQIREGEKIYNIFDDQFNKIKNQIIQNEFKDKK